jgi:hypothetical protein
MRIITVRLTDRQTETKQANARLTLKTNAKAKTS